MPVKFADHGTSVDQTNLLIELCRRVPWPNVTAIAVWAGPRKADPWDVGEILHVTDGKGVVNDDPTIDVRAFVERCKAHQRAKKRPITFVFAVFGVRTANVKGRKKTEDPEQVEFFTHSIRIGEGSEDEDESGNAQVDLAKVLAQTVKDQQNAYRDMLDRERASGDWLMGRWRESMDAATAGAAHHVEMAKVIAGAEKDKRQEAREERREREEAEWAFQDAQGRRAHNDRMAQHGKDVLGLFLGLYQVSKGHTPPPPPPPPGSPPSDGSILGDLRQLFTSITHDEQSRMRDAMGDDLWQMIGAALRSKDESELLAIMHGMKSYIQRNPSLINGIMASLLVISSGGRSTVLLGLLKRAKVIGDETTAGAA